MADDELNSVTMFLRSERQNDLEKKIKREKLMSVGDGRDVTSSFGQFCEMQTTEPQIGLTFKGVPCQMSAQFFSL